MKRLALFFVFLVSACWGEDRLEVLITPQEISQKIAEVAAKIDQEYQNEELTILMVMKGAVCVAADLMRQINTSCTLEYIRASSYGKNGAKRGELRIHGLEELDLTSKHVLLVDDIFDTGSTMAALIEAVQSKQPKSIKSLVLLLKNVPHRTTYLPDYALFEIEDHFVVGYGLDYKEKYRSLPGIYTVKLDTSNVR